MRATSRHLPAFPARRSAALLAVVLAIAAIFGTVAARAQPDAPAWREHRRAGLVFDAPAAAEVTEHTLEGGVQVVAVTLAEEVLILTVYAGAKAPTATKALATHLEELERRLTAAGPIETKKARTRLLGALRDGHRVAHRRGKQEHLAFVVAHREGKKGPTIVASWALPAVDVEGALAPKLLSSIRF